MNLSTALLRLCLPLLLAVTGVTGACTARAELPVLLGIYPHGGDSSPSFSQLADELVALDAWLATQGTSTGVSIGATFISLENANPDFNIPYQLEAFWTRGYTPFVNIMSTHTAAEIANGDIDAMIHGWADALKGWIDQGGGRRVFLAPLPEMNGDWVVYGLDPAHYILAYRRLQEIFVARGVPASALSWVFAPNGWGPPGHEFELYYPGDAVVDVVGFSAYNLGYCPAQWQEWKSFETIIQPHLERMRAMAPGKPIFLTQTGTVSLGPDGFDETLRSEWIEDMFTKAANFEGLRGILYFNKRIAQPALVNCLPQVDFRLFRIESNSGASGLASAMASADFGQWYTDDPGWELHAFPWPRPAGDFADVWPAHPFSGRQDPYYFDAVAALNSAQLTNGCGTDQVSALPTFCPHDAVTRAQMAVFVLRGMHGAGYQPAPATGTLFADVSAGHWAAPYIEQMYADGITAGCQVSPQKFCPNSAVSRAQMAVFLLRSHYWPINYQPPTATGAVFQDVLGGYWAAAWIEQLAQEGITGGCSAVPYRYCPEDLVTRAQMAVFLGRTFGF